MIPAADQTSDHIFVYRQCLQTAEATCLAAHSDGWYSSSHFHPDWHYIHSDWFRSSDVIESGVLSVVTLILSLLTPPAHQVNEKPLDYTYCKSINKQHQDKTCADVIAEDIYQSCECALNFTLKEVFERDVFVYYGLSNYYQNHRRYVKSRDDKQLLGFKPPLSKDCDPFKFRNVKSEGKEKTMLIAPCGAIANSLFNDTFEISFFDEKRHKFSPIRLLNTGIAWATDKSAKFRNPPIPPGGTLKDAFAGFTHPPYWRRHVWQLDNSSKSDSNNGYENEALIVWMRTAALPTFRKLYARIDHSSSGDFFTSGLPPGLYQAKIQYSKYAVNHESDLINSSSAQQTIRLYRSKERKNLLYQTPHGWEEKILSWESLTSLLVSSVLFCPVCFFSSTRSSEKGEKKRPVHRLTLIQLSLTSTSDILNVTSRTQFLSS